MERKDSGKDRPGPQPQSEQRDPRKRTVAPPIEREHETQKGALEEDEKREHERH